MMLGTKVFCATRLSTGSVLLLMMLSSHRSEQRNSGFGGATGNLISTTPHSFTPEIVVGSCTVKSAAVFSGYCADSWLLRYKYMSADHSEKLLPLMTFSLGSLAFAWMRA